MASIFKRGNTWWIAYYHNGRLRRKSLKTTNKRLYSERTGVMGLRGVELGMELHGRELLRL